MRSPPRTWAATIPACVNGPPSGDLYLDILARLGEAVHFEDLDPMVLEIEGVAVRLASPAALVRMKRGTVRPLDHADAAALIRRFNLEPEE